MKRLNRYGSKSLQRPRSTESPKPRILILCEGILTEPSYINGLIQHIRNPRVRVEVDASGGAPKTLVERAAERKKRSKRKNTDPDDKFDEYWCVFDVDQHENLPDALQQARDNKICVAVSNPCFELWILLHFQVHTRYEHRHKVQSLCGKYLPGYSKHVSYKDLEGGYLDAVRRAQELEKMHIANGKNADLYDNPSTGMYRLTERLLGNMDLPDCTGG